MVAFFGMKSKNIGRLCAYLYLLGRIVLCGMFSLMLVVSGHASVKPIATLVGVSIYQDNSRFPDLPNVIRDIEALETQLISDGYDVQVVLNPTRKQLIDAIENHVVRAEQTDINLFWYAGHGVQGTDDSGKEILDYMVPSDTRIKYREELSDYGVALIRLTNKLESHTKDKANIIFIDACRTGVDLPSKPCKNCRSAIGSATGLALSTGKVSGIFIGYSAGKGRSALDGGKDSVSYFVEAFLNHINKPLSINDMFTSIIKHVKTKTGGIQEPVFESGFDELFFFNAVDLELEEELSNELAQITAEKKQLEAEKEVLRKEKAALKAENMALHKITTVQAKKKSKSEFAEELGIKMVSIPSGSFWMGNFMKYAHADETPPHKVTLNGFKMMEAEVTWDQYQPCVVAGFCQEISVTNYVKKWGKGSRPVFPINWSDVAEYIRWLNKETGQTFRLPTEAEWEYAARAGSRYLYSWGFDIGENRANCSGCGSKWDGIKTAPVKSFEANLFGLFDMHGNVWEWVQDCWNERYEGAPIDGLSWETGDCSKRIVRGGDFEAGTAAMRSANRHWKSVSNLVNSIGFRLVQEN